MVALANLYTVLDVSIQQLAVGLAILASLVALAWYVSHPVHRRQLLATVGSDAGRDERVVDAAGGRSELSRRPSGRLRRDAKQRLSPFATR
jgi:hypothetical protein